MESVLKSFFALRVFLEPTPSFLMLVFQVAFLKGTLICVESESLFVWKCRGEAYCVLRNGGELVPLTASVSFKAVLQKGKRVQVPKLVRWKYKLEREQVLMVSVTTQRLYGWENFYARMDKSG
jgi:hypothetical protein